MLGELWYQLTPAKANSPARSTIETSLEMTGILAEFDIQQTIGDGKFC